MFLQRGKSLANFKPSLREIVNTAVGGTTASQNGERGWQRVGGREGSKKGVEIKRKEVEKERVKRKKEREGKARKTEDMGGRARDTEGENNSHVKVR